MGDGEIGAKPISVGGSDYTVETGTGTKKPEKSSSVQATDTISTGDEHKTGEARVTPAPGTGELVTPSEAKGLSEHYINVATANIAVAINLMMMCRTCRDISSDERRMGYEAALLSFGQALEVAKELKDLGKKKAAMYTTMAVMAGVSLCFTAISMGVQGYCGIRAGRAGSEGAARQWGSYGEIAGQLGRVGGSVGEIGNNLAQAKFAEQEGQINYEKTLHEAIKEAFQRYGNEADKAEKNLQDMMKELIQLLQRFIQVDQQLYTRMQ